MDNARIEQFGSPRELYDAPSNAFVMGFLGPVSQLGDRLVRPHDIALAAEVEDGALEAMVSRVIHLGFEVRVELMLHQRRGRHRPGDAHRGRRAGAEPGRHRLAPQRRRDRAAGTGRGARPGRRDAGRRRRRGGRRAKGLTAADGLRTSVRSPVGEGAFGKRWE